MRNVIIHIKNNTIYFIAAILGSILMIPYLRDHSVERAEYYLSTLSFTSLEKNISYIVQFIPVFLPLVLIQVYWGIDIYKRFCVASIYEFSRQKSRVRWAVTELLRALLRTITYIVIYILFSFLTLTSFSSVSSDSTTIGFLTLMSIILSLYSFEMIMLINLLAFFFESGVSFAIVQILNMLSIAVYLLSTDLKIEDSIFIKFSIFSRITVEPDYSHNDLLISLCYFLIPSVILVFLMILTIKKNEFTKSTFEGDS